MFIFFTPLYTIIMFHWSFLILYELDEREITPLSFQVDPGHPCQRSPRRKSEPTMPLIKVRRGLWINDGRPFSIVWKSEWTPSIHLKVTPSSPSPDPNHPDYPEFFEGRIFLEQQKRRKSSSRWVLSKYVHFSCIVIMWLRVSNVLCYDQYLTDHS